MALVAPRSETIVVRVSTHELTRLVDLSNSLQTSVSGAVRYLIGFYTMELSLANSLVTERFDAPVSPFGGISTHPDEFSSDEHHTAL